MTKKNELSTMWNQKKQLEELRKIYAENATDEEFEIFRQIGIATGLNPFLKEIWLVKYSGKAQIFIARDGYRKSAQQSPEYDYHTADAVYEKDEFVIENGEIKHKYSSGNRGKIIGAYCVVKRKSASKSSFVYVEYKEYFKNQGVWKDKPATMIKKVAEAQALRMAFQEMFSGTYHEGESWEDENTPKTSKEIFEEKEPYTIDKFKSHKDGMHKQIAKGMTNEKIIENLEDKYVIPDDIKKKIMSLKEFELPDDEWDNIEDAEFSPVEKDKSKIDYNKKINNCKTKDDLAKVAEEIKSTEFTEKERKELTKAYKEKKASLEKEVENEYAPYKNKAEKEKITKMIEKLNEEGLTQEKISRLKSSYDKSRSKYSEQAQKDIDSVFDSIITEKND